MRNLIKKLLLVLVVLSFGIGVFANDNKEALDFFNSFVSASNSYSPTLLNMYSSDAKIIRQIIKPDGQLKNAYFNGSQYKTQMKVSSKLAKMRNYKNYYSGISVKKVANGYRIDGFRKPSSSDYKLKMHMIVQKQPNGKWLIVEELMQTKEQILLKYAK